MDKEATAHKGVSVDPVSVRSNQTMVLEEGPEKRSILVFESSIARPNARGTNRHEVLTTSLQTHSRIRIQPQAGEDSSRRPNQEFVKPGSGLGGDEPSQACVCTRREVPCDPHVVRLGLGCPDRKCSASQARLFGECYRPEVPPGTDPLRETYHAPSFPIALLAIASTDNMVPKLCPGVQWLFAPRKASPLQQEYMHLPTASKEKDVMQPPMGPQALHIVRQCPQARKHLTHMNMRPLSVRALRTSRVRS